MLHIWKKWQISVFLNDFQELFMFQRYLSYSTFKSVTNLEKKGFQKGLYAV